MMPYDGVFRWAFNRCMMGGCIIVYFINVLILLSNNFQLIYLYLGGILMKPFDGGDTG